MKTIPQQVFSDAERLSPIEMNKLQFNVAISPVEAQDSTVRKKKQQIRNRKSSFRKPEKQEIKDNILAK